MCDVYQEETSPTTITSQAAYDRFVDVLVFIQGLLMIHMGMLSGRCDADIDAELH